MHRSIAFLLLLNACTSIAAEEILFESATLGPTGITDQQRIDEQIPGSNVTGTVFVGSRFELTSPATVSRIGGHFATNDRAGGDFIGAIIRLDGPSDVPDSRDLTTQDVLGISTLTFPDPSAEVFGSLELRLAPGWYSVIFGSGLFGSSGAGATIRNGDTFAGVAYLASVGGPDSDWVSPLTTLDGNRFVVLGVPVPEPAGISMCILAASLAGLCSYRR